MEKTIQTSKLAAKLSIRQIELLAYADDLGTSVDRKILAWWKDFWKQLARHQRQGTLPHTAELRKTITAGLHSPKETLIQGLKSLAFLAHDKAVDPLRHVLPDKFIRAQGALAIAGIIPNLETLYEESGNQESQLKVPGDDLPDPAAQMSKDDLWKALKKSLFPPPDASALNRIVYSNRVLNWQERLSKQSGLANPQVLAQHVISGMVQGKNLQELAKQIAPDVDRVRASARRVARTEGMRVAHTVQKEAWENLGDLCIGYQIHATLDQHTRPWHAGRSGTIYYKDPQPGQKGLAQMPEPPLEASDPMERPAGTPQVAYNCRCYLTPVLQPAKHILDPEKSAVFTTDQKKLVPDPGTYSQWFDQANERLRRLAVGSRRYDAVQNLLQTTPRWENFLDPQTGDLLATDRLKNEQPEERSQRLAKVDSLIDERDKLAQDLFGFLRPSSAPVVLTTWQRSKMLAEIGFGLGTGRSNPQIEQQVMDILGAFSEIPAVLKKADDQILARIHALVVNDLKAQAGRN